jgi:hypothetical protein
LVVREASPRGLAFVETGPSAKELQALIERIGERIGRALERNGLFERG